MSSLLVLQQKDRLFFGSDTAMSTTINGQDYRIKGSMKKIFKIDSKSLLFCSGKKKIVDKVISEIEALQISTVSEIRNVIKRFYQEYPKSGEPTFLVDAVIGTIEDGNTKLYQISPYNNFEILTKVVRDGEVGIWSAGIKTEESLSEFQSLISINEPIINAYKKTFDSIAYEKIGGELELFCIDKIGVSKIGIYSINRGSSFRELPSHLYKNIDLVAAETLIGRILIGQELYLENENGAFSFNQDGITVKNTAFNLISDSSGISNGVTINSQDGIVITKSDNKVKTILNSTDGIKIQVKKGNTWNNEFYYDVVNESLTVDGLINARELKINGQNVLTQSNTKINGLYVVNLNADTITSGSIDANLINVRNINASNITAGTLNASLVNVKNSTGNTYTTINSNGFEVFVNGVKRVQVLENSSFGVSGALAFNGINGNLLGSIFGIGNSSFNMNIQSPDGFLVGSPNGTWFTGNVYMNRQLLATRTDIANVVDSMEAEYYNKYQIDALLAQKQDK